MNPNLCHFLQIIPLRIANFTFSDFIVIPKGLDMQRQQQEEPPTYC